MREIKFRAWHKEQKRMYSAEELGIDQLTLMPDGRGFVNVHSEDTNLSRVDNGKRMISLQYTGLKDSKGVEIYEGDVVKNENGDILTVEWTEQEVGYRLCKGFIFVAPEGMDAGMAAPLEIANWYNLKVIGNIYENKEFPNETKTDN